MTASVQDAPVRPPGDADDDARPAAVCAVCSRVACFQARLEAKARAGQAGAGGLCTGSDGAGRAGTSQVGRRSNACASHVVSVIQDLSAWFADRDLAGGLLTVLAIDPYALPRQAGRGRHRAGRPGEAGAELQSDPGFAFCTIAIGGRAQPLRSP
jgi:hypothetical protein